MNNNRLCDVCRKSDLPCVVASSRMTAMSFNYCKICLRIRAEPKGLKAKVEYDEDSDKYTLNGKYIMIRTRRGIAFETRGSLVRFSKFH